MSLNLLTVGHDTKTIKGQKFGYETAILYLAPEKQSGVMNVCAFASKGCAESCLFTAGRGRFDAIKNARINRTKLFKEDNSRFLEIIKSDIVTHIRRAKKKDRIPVVRLNGTSDLPWENFDIMSQFPDIQFYDYTKNYKRMFDFIAGKLPPNYHLTFSRSEENESQTIEVIKRGGNVATVFAPTLPTQYYTRDVVDGDLSDLRFLDPKGVIVGLKAKGDAKKDTTGFVIKVPTE